MPDDPVVISSNVQAFNGDLYTKTKGTYYQRQKTPQTMLHRDVWAATNGPIPAGRAWHVHHLDENKDNNALSNLGLEQASEHISGHMTPERRAWAANNVVEKAVPAARAWHSTPEGRAWHAEHALAAWKKRKETPPTIKVCAECGKEYTTHRPDISKFCHQNCKQRARNMSVRLGLRR